jgi:hypothetical protein
MRRATGITLRVMSTTTQSEVTAIAAYLEALDTSRHPKKRGRKRSLETIEKRLAEIEEQLPAVSRIKALSLVQERQDLEAERVNRVVGDGRPRRLVTPELEEAFVDAAGPYSERKGISYAAWRELGVSPQVLKRAGITRSG